MSAPRITEPGCHAPSHGLPVVRALWWSLFSVGCLFAAVILVGTLHLASDARAASADEAGASEATAYVFTSFRGDGDGLHLAYSLDGHAWTDLDRVFLRSKVGSGLFRDPHLSRAQDGSFNLVWTTGWHDKGIGYASSRDLVNWSEPRFLAVMGGVEGTSNCWAPEVYYDETARDYVVVWSSDVAGRFEETRSQERMNDRAYYATTTDFEHLSEPKVLFDPGFDNIDTTIVPYRGKYLAIFKEGDQQRLGKWGALHGAVADSLTGPYKVLSQPIATARAEGPAPVVIGDEILLYVDFYADGHYGAYGTHDGRTWADVSGTVSPVDGQRHGTVLPVPVSLVKSLDPTAGLTPPVAVLPGLNADPNIAVFGDKFYLYPTTDGFDGWGATSFHAWSSTDLVSWKDCGVILDLPRDLKWADKYAWAPTIATKGGKYYYYYSARQSIGVAVGDRPEGPFTDPIGRPLVGRNDFQHMQAIDPMVFVDDDGSAYLYWGQGRCKAVRLYSDMISYDPGAVVDITTPGYNEGPFMFKRNGRYYLSWSEYDTRDPRYSVAYATSDSPLGPFVKAAVNPILKQKGAVKGAGHHSVAKLPGRDEWVIAYHRFHIPGGNGFNRETCLSPMRFDADGNILPVDVYEAEPPFKP